MSNNIKNPQSEKLFKQAKKHFPGGVNSPVRAFRSVGGSPIFMEQGLGSKIIDVDGNKYIDYCCSWGPLILGHANKNIIQKVTKTIQKGMSFGTPTELENQLANLIISNHNYIEKIRFVSSGTEATMSAIRLARGYTKKDKIIKFEGCYHGHVDSLLVNAGSGLATLGESSSAGVPKSYVKETIVLPLNNKEAVLKAIKNYKNEIAAIILEPIPANNGLLIQDKEYLNFLKEICNKENILIIFDEVISGFRVGFEGAAGYYNIQPDIFAFGKIIGGGMPVGAYASSAKIMSYISPEGSVYQAGTLSGNPVAMAAGIAQLKECLKPNFYKNLETNTNYLTSEIENFAKEKNYSFSMPHIGSIFWISFSNKKILSTNQINDNEIKDFFTKFYHKMLSKGIYLGPSRYEVGFVSEAHSIADIKETIKVFKQVLQEIF